MFLSLFSWQYWFAFIFHVASKVIEDLFYVCVLLCAYAIKLHSMFVCQSSALFFSNLNIVAGNIYFVCNQKSDLFIFFWTLISLIYPEWYVFKRLSIRDRINLHLLKEVQRESLRILGSKFWQYSGIYTDQQYPRLAIWPSYHQHRVSLFWNQHRL